MSEQKLGIEHLKTAVKFGVDFGGAIDESLKDGKFNLADAGNFYKPLMEIPGVMEASKSIVPEFKDLDKEEIAELVKYGVEELHIAEAKVITVIEASLKMVVSVYELMIAIKALKAAPSAVAQ